VNEDLVFSQVVPILDRQAWVPRVGMKLPSGIWTISAESAILKVSIPEKFIRTKAKGSNSAVDRTADRDV
jgi:hypothetical protein